MPVDPGHADQPGDDQRHVAGHEDRQSRAHDPGDAQAQDEGRDAVRGVAGAIPGAWRRGRFNYENATLAEVIADVNRYSERQVVFADDGLREVRVTTA